MKKWKLIKAFVKGRDQIIIFTFGIVPAYIREIRLALPLCKVEKGGNFFVMGKRREIPDLKITIKDCLLVDVKIVYWIPQESIKYIITSATKI